MDPHALRPLSTAPETAQAQVTVRTLHLSCKIRLPVLNSAFCCRCFGLSQKRCANSQQHRLTPAAEHSEFVALSTGMSHQFVAHGGANSGIPFPRSLLHFIFSLFIPKDMMSTFPVSFSPFCDRSIFLCRPSGLESEILVALQTQSVVPLSEVTSLRDCFYFYWPRA